MWPVVASEFVKVRVPLGVKLRVTAAAERAYLLSIGVAFGTGSHSLGSQHSDLLANERAPAC